MEDRRIGGHAAAIRIAGTTVVLLDVGGAGKSNLAAVLTRHGAEFVSDDVLVVESSHAPRLHPLRMPLGIKEPAWPQFASYGVDPVRLAPWTARMAARQLRCADDGRA